MKKLISLLLTACMVFALVPTISFANQTEAAADDPGITQLDGSVLMQDEFDEDDPEEAEDIPSFELQEEQWVQDEITGKWRYYTDVEQQLFLKGKNMVGAAYYYFDEEGFMQVGMVTATDGAMYYCNPDGDAPNVAGSSYGAMKEGFVTYKGDKYYFNPTPSFKMAHNWKTIGGSKYYFNPKSGKMRTEWLKLNGNRYYFGKNGKMVTGKKKINGETYYFDDPSGKMVTGFHTISGKKYYFADPSGKMKKNAWVTVSGSKYHVNAKGVVETGYRKIGSDHYYFSSSGKMQKGAIRLSGALYYFFSSGKAVKRTGWFKGSDGKNRYCYSSAGKIYTGQHKIGSYYYLFDSRSGVCTKNMGDATDRSIQSQSSSKPYLILVQKSNYTVRVYKGKKNNWSRIYTFSCAIGGSKATDSGTYTVRSKTDHHNYAGKHWNYGVNLTSSGASGNGFNGYVWSGTYPDGDIVDSRLGGRYTGGRVRVSENNAAWIYNNIPVGTKVIIR